MTTQLAPADALLDRFAEAVGTEGPVAVEGGRTRWALGGELAGDTRLVQAPTGIVDYRPDEMTCRVRAGTTVADLNAELERANQRTGLPERGGTVGGALAVGENHLAVLGRGRVRETALQVRYVSAEGRLVTGGGPTVKNVSGFDIPRLMVGSLGSLGLLGEVILRTNPIPSVTQWLVAADADPFAVLSTVLAPSAVLWDGQHTWVLLEGHGIDVEGDRALLRTAGAFVEASGAPPLPACRWSMAPAELRTFDHAATGAFVASIGVGQVYATNPAPARTLDVVTRTITDRLKNEFDPTGRLNPGRDAANR